MFSEFTSITCFRCNIELRKASLFVSSGTEVRAGEFRARARTMRDVIVELRRITPMEMYLHSITVMEMIK